MAAATQARDLEEATLEGSSAALLQAVEVIEWQVSALRQQNETQRQALAKETSADTSVSSR
jgi:hypothetical protein